MSYLTILLIVGILLHNLPGQWAINVELVINPDIKANDLIACHTDAPFWAKYL